MLLDFEALHISIFELESYNSDTRTRLKLEFSSPSKTRVTRDLKSCKQKKFFQLEYLDRRELPIMMNQANQKNLGTRFSDNSSRPVQVCITFRLGTRVPKFDPQH